MDDYVDATGHTESDWIVDQEATKDSMGKRHKECTVCHQVFENESTPIAESGISSGAVVTISVVSTVGATMGGFSLFWFVIKKKKFADFLSIIKR